MGFNLFGLDKHDLAIGAITLVTSPLGPIGGSLVGGTLSAVYLHTVEGKDWDDSIEQGLVDSAVGHLGGKFIGGAILKRIPAAPPAGAAPTTFIKGIKPWLDKTGRKAARPLVTGASAAVTNMLFEKSTSSSPAGISELPIKPIS